MERGSGHRNIRDGDSRDDGRLDHKNSFTNFDGVHNQAATQHIGGSVYHGPVYPTYVTDSLDTQRPARHGSTVKPDLKTWRQKCLDSLSFSQMDLRRDTIKTAHTSTCQWLLNSIEVRHWLSKDALQDHHGFLWIKGKPGSGKSTMMKFAMAHAKQKNPNADIVSFFFNARGEALEKSTLGMYRSVLAQILKVYPQLQTVLDECTADPTKNGWHLEILKDLIRRVVRQLGRRNLMCFVDALDECEEDETREMVEFFEELGRLAVSLAIDFRTCFSSRHYPHISIEKSLTLILENQGGHRDDISTYLAHELKIGQNSHADEIRHELLQRSSEIFLWVVLVVRILNKEFDRGRIHALRRRLNDIPNDLEALFHDILTRDGQPNAGLVLCVQWVLFARRPLLPEELYSAVLFETESDCFVTDDVGNVTQADVGRFLLHASKGLIEETKVRSKSSVQFIHESVRDFFLKGNRLQSSLFGPQNSFVARGHDQLKRTCFEYYQKANIRTEAELISTTLDSSKSHTSTLSQRIRQKKRLQRDFPLLSYSVRNLLYHSEIALELGITQQDFMSEFDLQTWSRANNFIHVLNSYDLNVSLLYILAAEDLPCLLADELQRLPSMDIEGGQHRYPLFVAQANKSQQSLRVLLHPQSFTTSKTDLNSVEVTPPCVTEALAILSEVKNIDVTDYDTPLDWAIVQDAVSIVKCLLDGGKADMGSTSIDSGSSSSTRTKVFEAALSGRRVKLVGFLSQCDGVEVSDTIVDCGATLISWALDHNLLDLIRLLIPQDRFNVNSIFRYTSTPTSRQFETLLHYAIRKQDTETLDLLLTRKDLEYHNICNRDGVCVPSPLEDLVDSVSGLPIIERLMSTRMIDVDKPFADGQTLLQKAIYFQRLDFLGLMLSNNDVKVTFEEGVKLKMLQQGVARRADLASTGANTWNQTVREYRTLPGMRSAWSMSTRHEDVASLKQVYRAHGIDLDETVSTSDVEVLLSDPLFNINTRNSYGQNLLHMAVTQLDTRTLQLLLSKEQLDVNQRDDTFRTALQTAIARRALQAPVDMESSFAIIEQLIRHEAVDVNCQDLGGRTALHLATRLEDPNVVALLLARVDIDVNAKDRAYLTPLKEALDFSVSFAIIEQLISHKAVDLQILDRDGETVIGQAVAQQNLPVVTLMLREHPECVNVLDKRGRTLLDTAIAKSDRLMERLLRARGGVESSRVGVNSPDKPIS